MQNLHITKKYPFDTGLKMIYLNNFLACAYLTNCKMSIVIMLIMYDIENLRRMLRKILALVKRFVFGGLVFKQVFRLNSWFKAQHQLTKGLFSFYVSKMDALGYYVKYSAVILVKCKVKRNMLVIYFSKLSVLYNKRDKFKFPAISNNTWRVRISDVSSTPAPLTEGPDFFKNPNSS